MTDQDFEKIQTSESDEYFEWGCEEENLSSRFSCVNEVSQKIAMSDIGKLETDGEREKFTQLLSERQELKRKNIYLQKKMAELFKKKKVDYVLKESPRGLDLESKYLKSLYEFQEYKKNVKVSRETMMENLEQLQQETALLMQHVQAKQKDFLEKQKKVAGTLLLTSKKGISTKDIASILAKQAMQAEEINKLRVLEIKEKRLLEEKLNLTKKLNFLGKRLKRADYELLQFQHENVVKLLEEKCKALKAYEIKIPLVAKDLEAAYRREHQVEKEVVDKKLWKEETEALMLEVKQRVQKLKKISGNKREIQRSLEKKTVFLSQNAPLLHHPETSQQEGMNLRSQKEAKICSLRKPGVSNRKEWYNK